MEKLASFFEGKTIGRVLDIGTGAGDFIQLLTEVFPSTTELIGVDPSEEALAEARKRSFPGKVNFLRMEGENLQFEDESFDVVCLSNAMHHLASPEKTFAEMKRVVKKEGWLVIAEIASDGLSEAQENQKMLHHFKSYVDRKLGITHRETSTRDEILDTITQNGIKPSLSFLFNRMAAPVTDPQKLDEWIGNFSDNLSRLKDYPEYEDKAALFRVFKERLGIYGYQLAHQVVVVGRK
jgi:ubiquinone/menaquinone biosynthesis C-methylase UbiE